MSKKSELKKAIEASKKEIAELEAKRIRSQSSLLEAILMHQQPDDNDAEYFRLYSSLIKVERENLKKLNDELKALKDK